MSNFRVIEATINPKRMDTLRDRVLPYVGQRMRFTYAWPIEEEDTDVYAGQDAWLAKVEPEAFFGWLPTEDLDDIEDAKDAS